MNEKISVIIPIYKVEKYLDRCIESVVSQTYQNLEIILVDDGSPDNCPKMCDEWSKKDERIVVIHKENGGLSDARNVGMKVASGEYVSFIDSDDWIDLNFYSRLLEAMKVTGSDVACCEFEKVCSNVNEAMNISCDIQYETFDRIEGMYELITEGKIKQVVWNKLYRKSILSEKWFEVGKLNEDEFWSYQILGIATRTVVIDYVGYFYFQRDNSIMGMTYSAKRLDAVEAKRRRQEFIVDKCPQLLVAGKRNLLYTCLYHGQLVLKNLDEEKRLKYINWLEHIYCMHSLYAEELKQMNLKDKIWLSLGKYDFKHTCNLRNFLKIGY